MTSVAVAPGVFRIHNHDPVANRLACQLIDWGTIDRAFACEGKLTVLRGTGQIRGQA